VQWCGAFGQGVDEGLFVKMDSYAIAFLLIRSSELGFLEEVTRWGLFLMRGTHFQKLFQGSVWVSTIDTPLLGRTSQIHQSRSGDDKANRVKH
jgi:hypothetical protein